MARRQREQEGTRGRCSVVREKYIGQQYPLVPFDCMVEARPADSVIRDSRGMIFGKRVFCTATFRDQQESRMKEDSP
jgi:hypothetical protein